MAYEFEDLPVHKVFNCELLAINNEGLVYPLDMVVNYYEDNVGAGGQFIVFEIPAQDKPYYIYGFDRMTFYNGFFQDLNFEYVTITACFHRILNVLERRFYNYDTQLFDGGCLSKGTIDTRLYRLPEVHYKYVFNGATTQLIEV